MRHVTQMGEFRYFLRTGRKEAIDEGRSKAVSPFSKERGHASS